jgi:hypothetical protein
VFSNQASLPAAGTGLIYAINDNDGGAVKRVGQFTTVASAVTQIASAANTDALYIGGAQTVLPISATVPFTTVLGDAKWALDDGKYVYKDTSTVWFNGFTPSVLQTTGSTLGTAAITVSELREGPASATNERELFAVNANKIARYVGKYTLTAGTAEVTTPGSGAAEIPASLTLAGTGSTLIGSTGVKKLHGEAETNLNKTWAVGNAAGTAADYVTFTSTALKYEKGAVLASGGQTTTEFEGNGLWLATTVNSGTGLRTAYGLYGFDGTAHEITYLGAGAFTEAVSSTSDAKLVVTGGVLTGKTLLNISAITGGHALAGAWAPYTSGSGTGTLIVGTTAAEDGITIGSTVLVGSRDPSSSSYIVSGAGELTGTGYVALTAANVYSVFVLDTAKKNGLVYVGSLTYATETGAFSQSYKYITVGAATEVLKAVKFAIAN